MINGLLNKSKTSSGEAVLRKSRNCGASNERMSSSSGWSALKMLYSAVFAFLRLRCSSPAM
eukprot:8034067-Lingulodinium_polyedra.AAC.1